MKSLPDIKAAMSRLYDEVESGATELEKARELANIAGKYLKADQLEFAREVFQHSKGRLLPAVNGEQMPKLLQND